MEPIPTRVCVLLVLLTPFTLLVDLLAGLLIFPAVFLIDGDGPWPFTPELWKRLL